LRTYPDYPAALLERGNNALLDGDEPAAERDFARAIALDPGNIQIRNQYALALARNGKQSESAKQYEAVKQLQEDSERMTDLINGPLQSRPNDPALHHEIGAIALRSGLVPEAIRWFESALQVSPDHLPTHRTLAGLYQQLDNPVLAARHRAIAQRLASAQLKP
jgi:Flp pilus assembly protein TadD